MMPKEFDDFQEFLTLDCVSISRPHLLKLPRVPISWAFAQKQFWLLILSIFGNLLQVWEQVIHQELEKSEKGWGLDLKQLCNSPAGPLYGHWAHSKLPSKPLDLNLLLLRSYVRGKLFTTMGATISLNSFSLTFLWVINNFF